MRTLLRKALAVSPCLPMFVLSLAVGHPPRSYAQTQVEPDTQTKVAALREPSTGGVVRDGGAASNSVPGAPAATPNPEISPAVAKELAAMRAEIELLRAELKGRGATELASPSAGASGSTSAPASATKAAAAPSMVTGEAPAQEARTALPAKPAPTEPFAYADWDLAERHCSQQRRGLGLEVFYA